MIRTKEVLDFLNEIAPMKYALGFDNVGLLVGHGEREVAGILVALDITDNVIREAKEKGANLIVSHHPVIFEPMKSVVVGDSTANHVIGLLINKISAICMHTNLDAAIDGVNDTLADIIGISKEGYLEPIEDVGIGRFGDLECETDFDEFLANVAEKLGIDGLRYSKANDKVKRVAVGGGSCGGMLKDAVNAGCDTFITADVKHSVWLEAIERKINLIDAGHFSTENVIVSKLCDKLRGKFPELNINCAENSCVPFCHFKIEEAE
ncbi:MAG: Nif3-like dinuclear metal center hexameric protein [Clostridia bacterium]|nr:Nif3-like dinuclear metal center hexameric protein [Clostridia bacterium]